jgi:ribosome-binding protein aMBF1 (putative translation factor)
MALENAPKGVQQTVKFLEARKPGAKKTKIKNPYAGTGKDARKLRQMYERLFPDIAERTWMMRQAFGKSQKELAAEAGLSAGVFSNLECGYSIPTGRSLVKIGGRLGVSADYLLGLSERREL